VFRSSLSLPRPSLSKLSHELGLTGSYGSYNCVNTAFHSM